MHRQFSPYSSDSLANSTFASDIALDKYDPTEDSAGLEAEVKCLLDIDGTLGTALGMAELD